MNSETRRRLGHWGFDEDEIDRIADLEVAAIDISLLTLGHTLRIERKVNQLMADLSGLEAAVQKISEVDQSAAQSLAALRDEVAELQAGEISQEQIDSLASKLNDASTQLANAVTPAEPTPEGEPPAETPETPAEPPAEEAPPAEA